MTVQEETATSGIILSDEAATKVASLLAQEGRDDLQLRIAVQPGGCSGLRYQLFFLDDRLLDGDIIKEFGAVSVVTDRMFAPYFERRDHRLRRHNREAGLYDRQPQRAGFVRVRRLFPLSRPEPTPEPGGPRSSGPPAFVVAEAARPDRLVCRTPPGACVSHTRPCSAGEDPRTFEDDNAIAQRLRRA